MKKIATLVFVLLLANNFAFGIQSKSSDFGLSNGETVKKYDKHGSYQGYYRQSGSTIKKYGKTGNYQGSYKQSGSKIKYYDKTGSYQGYYKK